MGTREEYYVVEVLFEKAKLYPASHLGCVNLSDRQYNKRESWTGTSVMFMVRSSLDIHKIIELNLLIIDVYVLFSCLY
jgi:hypothetical protein